MTSHGGEAHNTRALSKSSAFTIMMSTQGYAFVTYKDVQGAMVCAVPLWASLCDIVPLALASLSCVSRMEEATGSDWSVVVLDVDCQTPAAPQRSPRQNGL